MTDLPVLPTDAAFTALDKTQQKQLVLHLLGAFLDHLTAAGRAPDDWEAKAFSYTVSCLRLGAMSSALPELKRLLTPAPQRPDSHGPGQTYPPDVARLRAELDGLAED